jgi:putative Mg2+ transporter-C (MgtC) family protein
MLGLVALAAAVGGAIGFEREQADKPAGLRTHMIVSAASALIVLLGEVAVDRAGTPGDPTRALHGIITGIGFLGAGTIIFRRDHASVEGLTTAASLLFTAGIGVAIGLGQVLLAVGAAVLVVATLRIIGFIEHRMHLKGGSRKEEPAENRDDQVIELSGTGTIASSRGSAEGDGHDHEHHDRYPEPRQG